MSSDNAGHHISNLATGHFHDAGALATMSGWDLSFRQLDPGPHSIPFFLLHSARVTVLRIRYNRGFHHYGCTPRGVVTVGIPEEGMQDWFGRPCQDQAILPFNQAYGLDLVSRPGFVAYSISIAEDFLWSVAARCRLPVADCLCDGVPAAVIPDSRAVQNLRGTVRDLFLDHRARFRDDEEEALAIELLLAALGSAGASDEGTPAARAKAIARTLEYIDQHRLEDVRVGDICAATGSSWRTLDRAFLERFGLGPKAYLQRARLARARTELAANRRGVLKVSDVANKWGFWHMGQFASDYRKVYGELPSETLNRTRV